MRLIFVRHGESEANVAKVLSTRGWKHPLTACGREQCRLRAAALVGRGVTAILASPLMRAVETATILADHLRVPVAIEPALVEYDCGDLEGNNDEASWREMQVVEARWAAGEFAARLPGGESCDEIRSRFSPMIARTIERSPAGDSVLVMVGHGGTFRFALPAVLANVALRYAVDHPLANAAAVDAPLRDGRLVCVRWADDALE